MIYHLQSDCSGCLSLETTTEVDLEIHFSVKLYLLKTCSTVWNEHREG